MAARSTTASSRPTIEGFFRRALAHDPYQESTVLDWLAFPQQELLGIIAGEVFHDGLGELNALREKFGYYPRDVWLYLVACQWMKISQEEPFPGRCAEAGDELGSRIRRRPAGERDSAALFPLREELRALQQVARQRLRPAGLRR